MFQHGRVLLFCCACMCGTGCVSVVAPVAEFEQPGDADGNGKIDIWDVRSIQRSATTSHLHVRQPRIADVSQNGVVDEGDAEAVAKRLEGISTLSITITGDTITGDTIAGDVAEVQDTADEEESEPKTHFVGDTLVICAIDTFLPKEVRRGTIRIQSAAANYDSGELTLARHVDGRSFYYRWRTSGLKSAHDYRITATLHKQTSAPSIEKPDTLGNSKEITFISTNLPSPVDAAPPQPTSEATMTSFQHSREMTLAARDCEVLLLDASTDVALPFWDIGLHFTRRYLYDPYAESATSTFGYGWSHQYELRLQEDTDGSISIVGAGRALGSFRRVSEGRYEPPAGLHARLTRDSDGSFRLLLGSGDHWHFNNDLISDAIVDSNGHRLKMKHDEEGVLTSVEDESGQHLRFQYDDAGRLAGVQDSLGRFMTYRYSDSGDLTSVTAADGREKRYRYDKEHRLTEIGWGSHWKQLGYDEDGRLMSIRTSGEGFAEIAYNRSSTGDNIRTICDESGCREAQRLSCDGLVQVRELASEDKISLHRDEQRRMVEIKHGNESWTLERDEFNRTTSLPGPQSQWQVAYRDVGGGPISIQDGNGIETRMRYLDSGQPTHFQFPDGTVETRYYTKSKDQPLMKRVLRNGQFITYRYDKRGLLIEKRLPDRSQWKYTYDDLGNLTSAQNAWGRLEFKYKGAQLAEVIYPGKRRYIYTYDGADRLVQLTNPDGEVLKYVYSPSGRLETIQDERGHELATYQENAAGHLVERRLGAAITKYGYADGNLHSLEHQSVGGTPLIARAFQCEGSQVRIVEGTGGSSYQYNSANQLVSVKYGDGSREAFAYDQAGNRLQHTNNDKTIEYAPNVLNQYTAINSEIRQHDLNGNLNSEVGAAGRVTYEYDAECRLVRVRMPGPRTIQYVYDPLGRLATRIDGNESQRFLWDRDQIELVQNNDGVTQKRFVWGRELDELVAIQQNDQYAYSLMDQFGNVEALVNGEGNIIAQWQYKAFGELTSTPASPPATFAFAGAYYEPATNLCLINQRWYSPATATFLQPQSSLGGNRYLLARRDPWHVPRDEAVAVLACESQFATLLCPRSSMPTIHVAARCGGFSTKALQVDPLMAALQWQPIVARWQSAQGISP